MFRLRSILVGHELDVRAVAAVAADSLVSCSRDGTARVWHLDTGASETAFRSPARWRW